MIMNSDEARQLTFENKGVLSVYHTITEAIKVRARDGYTETLGIPIEEKYGSIIEWKLEQQGFRTTLFKLCNNQSYIIINWQ